MTYTLWQLCDPVVERLRLNVRGFLAEFRSWIMVAFVAGFADMVTTVRFMVIDGIEDELHPFIRMVSFMAGPVMGPVIGKACQFAAIGLVTVYWRSMARYVFFTATMMYAWAAWYNMFGREMYSPMLFELIQP